MANILYLIFKSYIFWVVFTTVFCVLLNIGFNILVIFSWNYLMNNFVNSSYLFIRYFIIIILFFYNYFLLRKIVISWIFEWQYPFQIFSIYKERQIYLKYLKARLNDLKNVIDVLLDDYKSLPNIESESIETFFYIFNEEFDIYNNLYNIIHSNNNNNLIEYKMSRCQIKYFNLLKSINDLLNESNLKNDLLNKKFKTENNKEKNDIDDNNNIIDNNNLDSQNNLENLKQLKILLEEYQKIIAKYDIENYTYMSPAYLFNIIFNDTFGSLSLYSLKFKRKFKEYKLEENFTPKGKIHYTLIRNLNINNNINNEIDNNNNNIDNNLISENSKNNLDDGVLMIFCLPNGSIYELMPKTKIEFYLNNGFSFLCWNYNGYGYSKGKPKFSNLKTNVLELYDIIVNNPKYNFKKICAMGHSIGGVPAFFLAKNRHVDLLISDRNFCDIKRIVNNFYSGQILSFLFKLLFIGNTNNIDNFMTFNLNNLNSIIIYSPLDNMIVNDASAKSGISRSIIKKYVIYNNKENSKIIRDKENILDIVFEKNEKERFINAFLELLHLYYDNNNNIDNDENDYYDEEKGIYSNSKNIQKKDSNNIDNTDNNEDLNNQNKALNKVLFKLFDKFYGCTDELNIFIKMKISLRRQKIFIDNFFNNLLIWGIQGDGLKEDDLNFYSFRGKIILKEAYDSIKDFSDIIQTDNKQILLLNNFTIYFSKIINALDNLDIFSEENVNNNKIINNKDNSSLEEKLITNNKENNIDTKVSNDLVKDEYLEDKNFYDKLNNIKGNIKLLKTYSGHNGFLKQGEIEQFYIFLLSSGIIK